MTEPMKKMKTIWYFVGLVLMSMGAVVLLTGGYLLVAKVEVHTVLSNRYPNLWWGGLMILVGLIFWRVDRITSRDTES